MKEFNPQILAAIIGAIIGAVIAGIIGSITAIVMFEKNKRKEKEIVKKEIKSNLIELIPLFNIKRFQRSSDQYAIHYCKALLRQAKDRDVWENHRRDLERYTLSFEETFNNDLNLAARLRKYYYLYEAYFESNPKFKKLYKELISYEYKFPEIKNMSYTELREKNLEKTILEYSTQHTKDTSPKINEILKILDLNTISNFN